MMRRRNLSLVLVLSNFEGSEGRMKDYSEFSFLLSHAFAPMVETKEPHASTPCKQQSTLSYLYRRQANLKIAALASNSPVNFQTEVPTQIGASAEKRFMFADTKQIEDLYTQNFAGPVVQCNLVEAQSNRLPRPHFSFSSSLLNHRNHDSSVWY